MLFRSPFICNLDWASSGVANCSWSTPAGKHSIEFESTHLDITDDSKSDLDLTALNYAYFIVGKPTLYWTDDQRDTIGVKKSLIAVVRKGETGKNNSKAFIYSAHTKDPLLIASMGFFDYLSAIVADMGVLTAGKICLPGADPKIILDGTASPPTLELKEFAVAKGIGFSRAFWGGFEWRTLFESLDAFEQSNSNTGSITLDGDGITLDTGATSGSRAKIWRSVWIEHSQLTWNKPRRAKVKILHYDNNVSNQRVWIAMGWIPDTAFSDPWTATYRHVGITIADGIAYGSVANGTNRSESAGWSVPTTPEAAALYEMVFYPGSKAEFYMDGVLKATITENLPADADDAWYIMLLGIINGIAEVRKIYASEWCFLQEP